MNAKDIMTSPVITVGPDTPLDDVLALLLEHRISGVLVVEDGQVVGTVGDGDVRALAAMPDGSLAVGGAFSTINGGTEGKWEKTAKGALCTWPDGWVDLIMRVPEGWQKRSWVGSETNAPADNSEATRVGEARFFITP